MNTIAHTSVTMTSREIAELVNSRHDHVKTSIERLANQGVIVQPATRDEQSTDAIGRPRTTTVYVFTGEQGKRDSIIVVAQLSPEFTARLVDRWQELEKQLAQPSLNPANLSRLQLIQLAMEAEQEKLELESKVQTLEPKAVVADRIAEAQGSVTIREAANTLGIPERKFVLWLQQNNWCYRRAGHKSLLAYAEKVKAGYLVLKQTPIRDANTGEERLSEQVRITPLGLTKLAKLTNGTEAMRAPNASIASIGTFVARPKLEPEVQSAQQGAHQ